jgi:hypothetical protein
MEKGLSPPPSPTSMSDIAPVNHDASVRLSSKAAPPASVTNG